MLFRSAATTPAPLLSSVASTAAPSRTAMHPRLPFSFLPPLFPRPVARSPGASSGGSAEHQSKKRSTARAQAAAAARRRAARTHHRSKQRPTMVSSSAACAWRGQQHMSARPWPSNRPAPTARRRMGPTPPAPSRSSPQGSPPLRGRLHRRGRPRRERLLLSSLWQLCKRGADCFFFLDLRVCV